MKEANVQNDRGVMWGRITKILIAFIVLMIIVDVVLYIALTKSEQNKKIRPAIFFRSIDILSKSFVVAIDDNNCGMRWITMGQRGELEDRGNYYGSMEEDGSLLF